ncbi:hypothetical protein [Jiulongibacter sediminis]|uniref:hypothetical protein n=1 Tax=Jiulongibacter sediminis TaxID=1605367 RepID=UPI0026ED0DEF|nr:hypothetical protein [Jiulongibacter sediminis]
MKKVMLCLVTEQNVTNVLPALLLKIDLVIPVYTYKAYSSGWVRGMEYVLKEKSISMAQSTQAIYLGYEGEEPHEEWNATSPEEGNLGGIRDQLLSYLNDLGNEISIYFNIGGGLKLHTMALQQAFSQYNSDHKYLVYLNSQTADTQLNCYDHTFELQSAINLRENWDDNFPEIESFVRLFFLNYDTNKTQSDSSKYNFEFLRYPETRAFLSYYANSDESVLQWKLFKEVLKPVRHHFREAFEAFFGRQYPVSNEHTSDIFYSYLKKFRIDFEKIKMDISQTSVLKNYFPERKVIEPNLENYAAWSLKDKETPTINPGLLMEFYVAHSLRTYLNSSDNLAGFKSSVEILKGNTGKKFAEYDILLLTKEGRLLGFDVKNTQYGNKDFQADEYKLRRLGGAFIRHYLLVPYFTADRDEPYFKSSSKTLRVIGSLIDREIPFCLFTDDHEEELYFTLDKQKVCTEISRDNLESSSEKSFKVKTILRVLKENKLL